MPLDPYFAEKMRGLQKFHSVAQAMSDPATAQELIHAFQDAEMGDIPDGPVIAESVDTRDGSVGIRVYSPNSPGTRAPIFVWVHGGGFAGGSISMAESDTVARELAFTHGVPVVTVDYALSNGEGVTYPTPHRQVAHVYRWARANIDRWGAADRPVSLGGASAGSSLAAGVVLELRDDGERLPDSVILVYPLVHRELLVSDAIEADLAASLGPTRMDQGIVDHMFALYTGGRDAQYASADRHELGRFPRTLTVVSECDDLRPSGEKFHADLLSSGVDAVLYLAEGMPHGHLDRTRLIPEVRQTVTQMAAFLTAP